MRKEPFGIGNYVHVYNRGNRKMDIFRDDLDRWRFLASLRFFNDVDTKNRTLRGLRFGRQRQNFWNILEWPTTWPPQKPLVRVIAYCLMPNHYHLFLREIMNNGIPEFIRKLGTGYTN